MPADESYTQVTLLFPSIASLSAFKNECACADFYIDRDALSLVGSFQQGQIDIAVEKYRARFIAINA
ncbi:MAG: hypothetical protein EOO14_14485 [Chitinophagaceae bacterium]|nr:MAG: hypothetical protein EOO14_14485 [Chitinophagaceae bacterium]